MIKAINKRYQYAINRVVKHLTKYNVLNDLRNEADGRGDLKELNKLEKQCEDSFNKYLETLTLLPAREIKQIEKSNLY